MAGFYSEDDISKVREATDLISLASEQVQLKQRGHDFWCCCPIHQEKTPSCKLDPSSQLWHCFGCGEGGDIFGWVMKTEGLNFGEAVQRLAERAHIEIRQTSGKRGPSNDERTRLQSVCEETAAFYHLQLMRSKRKEAQAAREYLASRGFGGKVPKAWNLGFAPGSGTLVRHLREKGFTYKEMIDANVAVDARGRTNDRFYNRVMFPIRDANGDTIAFGGRVIGQGEPKYLNSQETPIFHKSNVLYGLDAAKNSIVASGIAIVVEGYTDVIALHEAGVTNVVATLGTALTIQHIRLLSRHAKKQIVYLFDGDEAGQRAADRALGFIDENLTPEAGKTRIELAAVTLPDNLDPADYVATHGGDALRKLIEHAKPLLEYGIDRRLSRYDLSTAEGRARAQVDALSILAPIKTSLLAKDYAIYIAGKTGAREADIMKALEESKVSQRPRESATQESSDVGNVAVAPSTNRALTQREKSRRLFEKEVLCLLVDNPSQGIMYADRIANIDWHAISTLQASQQLLQCLMENPAVGSDELRSSMQSSSAQVARLFAKPLSYKKNQWKEELEYRLEELEIGDKETLLTSLKALVDSKEANDDVFAKVVQLQSELATMKAQHKI